ncbi:MAG: GNAT family N-acetyltransferase [Solirubrobacteraceae bacterium]|nr:GNAT family N-acetyltransferase [Solirubrobacteraceae bacterium]
MADDLVIRQLTDPAELDVVAPLWKALQAHHVSLGSIDLPARDPEDSWRVRRGIYEHGLAEGAWLWVAERAGEPVGYAFVSRAGEWASWQAGPLVGLETLVVAPGERGAGIGERLLQTAKDGARSEGYTHLQVGYIEGNVRAAAFYERAGFTPVERVLGMAL